MLKVYLDPMSQPSRALLSFLLVNNIPHELNKVLISKMQNRSEEFLAINPLGQVPAIDDNGFKLAGSHSILSYLHDTRGCPDYWYPRDPQKRAEVDSILHWHHTSIRIGSRMFFEKWVKPLIGMETNEKNVEQARTVYSGAQDHLENLLT